MLLPSERINGKGRPCFTIEGVAFRLSVGTNIVKQLIKEGKLTSSERNKEYFNKEDIEDLLARCTSGGLKGGVNYQKSRKKVTGFDFQKPASLYYLRINLPRTRLYKIGITNKTVKARYSAKDFARVEVLFVKKFPRGIDAYRKEQEILGSFIPDLYKGEKILESVGTAEIFTQDVLKIDTPARSS